MKKECVRVVSGCLFVFLFFCIVACEKTKPEGKVEIRSQSFSVRQDEKNSCTIDAKGIIRNTGKVDLKKVVLTGYCRDCGEVWVPGRWFVGADKMPEQKAVIDFLAVGKEAEFSFTGVADMFRPADATGLPPLPNQLEVVVESFETVDE